MGLKYIHIVGLKSPQRRIDRLHDVLARQALVVMPKLAYGPVGFGQILDRFPAHPAQRGAQYFLRSAICIRVRGVEGRDSSVNGSMNAIPRGVVFDLWTGSLPVAVG